MPGVRDVIDGTALLCWGEACLDGLAHRRAEINALNVFPVPDADTGTNLLATMRAAMAATADLGAAASTHDVAAALARGATLGARGNSGIIVSQVLRGLAEAVHDGPLTGATLRDALSRAAALVRAALSVPIEGTILTVLECAAASAASCRETALADVAVAAADGAAKALGDTPSQLGVLRAAGVVDAGARGLVVLLDSLVEVILGEGPARPAYARAEPAPVAEDIELPSSAPHFEVMYLLGDTDDGRIAALRARLAELGDSVVVVGDGSTSWSAHVHCADAGAAIEAGIAAGSVRAIRVESFAITVPADALHIDHALHADGLHTHDALHIRDGLHAHDPQVRDRGVLAIADGRGSAELFEAAGAVVLGTDGPVTTDALLAAIRRMPHREVLVLPNGVLPAQELVAVGVAARDARRDVLLLPSGSMVQGLAALAVHDRDRIAVDDAFAMSEAAAGTRWGSLRAADERALTMVGMCETGDGLGLVGHDVVVIDRDVRAAGQTLLDRMLGLGGELVTLLMGATAPAGLADELVAHIGRGFPGVEVTVYCGGQHGDLVQIGVE
ncbi:DAK2 domain-containing protein [Nocardia sp. NPDC052566]|uniref:DAK2 domain-containing protein n=1 Tax=Nocardia sp. NPDC052566 TaxID=3364330 RepID=UPI0037C51DA2